MLGEIFVAVVAFVGFCKEDKIMPNAGKTEK